MNKSRIVYLEHESQVLSNNPLGDPYARTLPVYLPPGYDDEPPRRYPVIWVLAPFTSWGQRFFNLQAWDENIIQRMDRLIGSGQARPAIMAFPDAFTRYGGSQYVNSSATGRYEDYLTQELVPLVDRQFRTLPTRDHRAVMGYSSGGFGALIMAMRHPELFGALACHSGDMFFEACYWPDIPGAVRAFEQFGGVSEFLKEFDRVRDKGRDWLAAVGIVAGSACYSPNPGSPYGFDLPFDPYTGEIDAAVWQRWQAFDPVHLAPQNIDTLKRLRGLYFDCGTRDEYNLFLGARRLHRLLDLHDVPHVYQEFDGGHRHINWRYDTSLPFLTASLASGEE
jgi:enterochelin esterase-like enzyme